MIGIHSDPTTDWTPQEAAVWGTVGAALDYDLRRLKRHSDKLDEVLRDIDKLMGKKHVVDDMDLLSFNAKIVLRRLKGERIRMDTDRHLAGLSELARKGLITKKSRGGWKVVK